MAFNQQQIVKIKGVADIVFCIDITQSMQPCIDKVKENIDVFIKGIKLGPNGDPIDWRARVIGYRDFEADTQYLFDNFDFSNSPDEIKNQLDQLVADGGGDEPESTLDAIMYAVKKSQWRSNCLHAVVVFTDSPTKPQLDSKTAAEFGIPADLEVFKQELMKANVKLFLFAQKDSVYEELNAVPRTYITTYENALEGLKNADFNSLLDQLGKTLSQQASTGVYS